MNLCKNLKFLRLARFCMRSFGILPPAATAKAMVSRPSKNAFTLEPLENRELIRVHGGEVIPFLQGLVTNDVARLQASDGPSSIYALFLNRGGRVLYDTIIYRTNDPNTYLLECDREASSELRRHLRTFRVRKRIEIDSVDDEYVPWVIFNEGKGNSLNDASVAPELFITPDPRLPTLGIRVLAPTHMGWGRLVKSFWRNNELGVSTATPESNYKLLRYKQGVGEGINELPPGKCLPLEANADFLSGVSFNKGCYMGQELTARVHHSGVIRKRYMPIRLTGPVKKSMIVKSLAGANLGHLFGHTNDRALALLRIEQVLNGQQELIVDGERCYAEKPCWWPIDLTSKRRAALSTE
ncbi:putative transferase CAF17, mitochondrial [Scaptodrosophila lebanonensis]|uniref:Transferase CAF17, mitochondrial n=1 Tax=Drosophila lebanonensis TaxID=7225 RepID=A0A6J2T4L6_DROLE|nr:putative transferase CAF17, mitochondrial [Scaptodrosophila lebanonensis]